MVCSVRRGAVLCQGDLDALLRIFPEFESFDAHGEIEKVRLNRRKIELGAGQESQRRRPNAGRADRALDGQRLALNLTEFDRNLAADADADESYTSADTRIVEHRRQRGVVAGGLNDQVGTLAVGQRQHFRDRVTGGRIDRRVDTDFLSRCTTHRQRIDQDHARAHAAGRRSGTQADIAAAGNDYGLRPIGAAVCFDCVEAGGLELVIARPRPSPRLVST
jgi:hypothetical protein